MGPSAPSEDLLSHLRARRRHRGSVRTARLLTLVLAVGLLAVWAVRPPAREVENRLLAQFPDWAPTRLLDGDHYRAADAALRDRLALRQFVAEAVGEASRAQPGGSLSPQVVLGSGGIPFAAEDFTLPCERPFDPGAVDAGLQRLRAFGAQTGRSITVAIAPDKSAILTDRLGRRGPALLRCSAAVRAATERTWPEGSAAPVLTTWRELTDAARAHPGQMFQYGDSHWTTRGALVFSQALIEHLVEQGDAPADLRGHPRGEYAYDEQVPSDLYRLMGLERADTVEVWRVRRAGVTVRTATEPTASGRGLVTYTAEADGDVPMISGRTLVITDSFFSRAELALAPFFTSLSVMHYADFLPAVQQDTLPTFDRIILETVQRGWVERAVWLQQGQQVHEVLARRLAAPRPES